MGDLRTYETYTRGNIDKSDIVPVKIFTHNTIDEYTLERIKQMPFDEVRKLGKVMGWQVWRLDD